MVSRLKDWAKKIVEIIQFKSFDKSDPLRDHYPLGRGDDKPIKFAIENPNGIFAHTRLPYDPDATKAERIRSIRYRCLCPIIAIVIFVLWHLLIEACS